MADVPDDPFWAPDPDPLEEVILGGAPFVLLQVVRGPVPVPGNTEPFVIEVHSGGGLELEDVPTVLRAVVEALPIADIGIMPDGTLVRRSEAPPSPE